MRLLLDSSVLIDHLRGHAGATDFLAAAGQQSDELLSSVLVRAEILAGVRPPEEERVQDLFRQVHWLEVTVEIADVAGRFARRYLRSHPGVDTVDYLIAATARVHGAELKTRNVKHFPMFPGLRRAY